MRRLCPTSRIQASLSTDWHLNRADVEARWNKFGHNDIIAIRTNRFRELLQNTAQDPMIWFLLITGMLFGLLGDRTQMLILLLATLPLIGMDAFLHWRTQISTRSLSDRLATQAIVMRDGDFQQIPVWMIVPGDLVRIQAGQSFPADGLLLSVNQAQVDESALTGESYPVSKQALLQWPSQHPEPTIDDKYWGFAGTRLLSGEALLRVIFTGKETLYGQIVASTLEGQQSKTPLQQAIQRLVFSFILIATAMCALLAIVRFYQGFGMIDALLSAATLAIAALPDEFPVVFTFFLGMGIYQLAQKKALVRRAVSVENMGRITCICVDKTGTVTEGRFQLSHYLPTTPVDKSMLLQTAAMASQISSGDLMDLAIIDAYQHHSPIVSFAPIGVFPFTEARKKMAVITALDSSEYYIAAVKGAPETIFSLVTLSPQEMLTWKNRVATLALSGHKIIACARTYLKRDTDLSVEPTHYDEFLGLLAFEDPPREEAAKAVQHCQSLGIHVLMITGDHVETARAVAKLIGLGGHHPVVLSAEDALAELERTDAAFLRHVHVIARALPSQKRDFVQALQTTGEIVAVTGDGVNDVPALKIADIGIAMGERGTQSAREVASIVLLDDNFNNIANAISVGKQLFQNLRLSFKYLIAIHIPFVLSAAILPLLGFPLLYLPLHIVWIELIIHPTAMLVFQQLPTTFHSEEINRSRKTHFFSLREWIRILATGLSPTVILILYEIQLLGNDSTTQRARAFALALLGTVSAAITVGLSRLSNNIARIVVFCTLITTFLLSFQLLTRQDWIIIALISVLTLTLSQY